MIGGDGCRVVTPHEPWNWSNERGARMCDQSNPSKGHYQFDLDCQVETCIQNYEEAMKDWYAKGGPTDPELSTAIFDQAERFAGHVLKATEELAPVESGDNLLIEKELGRFLQSMESHRAALASIIEQKGLSADTFLTALRELASDTRPDEGTILKVAWELLLVKSMWDGVGRSRRAATRLLLLSDLRVPANPTVRVRAFLKQAAQCFVWGFDVPCIVFCRSAIDVALKDLGFEKGNLKERINKTSDELLDPDHKRYAHDVRDLGNDAVHDKPLAVEDVLEVIRKTLLVLQQLTQSAPGGSFRGSR